MLAFYLAAPEVESDRRDLNIFYGLRQTRKEGRWINGTPLGYANLSTEQGKKYIASVEPAASIMKWVFKELVKGAYNQSQVFNEAIKRGLSCKFNNFYDLIHNPVYCGMIVVPKHKEEEEHWVKGQHEPIISEDLFYRVKEFLAGIKKEVIAPKMEGDNLDVPWPKSKRPEQYFCIMLLGF